MTWPLVPIGECAAIVSGSTPSTSQPAYWGGDIRWATPKDLSELQGSYIDDTPRKLTSAGLHSCGAEVLPANSVLFSSRAPIGLVAIDQLPMATNQGFKSFVPKPQKLESRYLFHWLRANRERLQAMGNGATFKEVSKAIVSRVSIPLPPIEEQRRIADILDKAEALRAKRREAIARLDTLTQSIFIEMFGDPVTNPREWPLVALGSVMATSPIFGTMIPPLPDRGEWLSIRVANIQDWRLDLSDQKYVSLMPAAVVRHSVRDGDLLMARAIASQEHLGKSVVAYPAAKPPSRSSPTSSPTAPPPPTRSSSST